MSAVGESPIKILLDDIKACAPKLSDEDWKYITQSLPPDDGKTDLETLSMNVMVMVTDKLKKKVTNINTLPQTGPVVDPDMEKMLIQLQVKTLYEDSIASLPKFSGQMPWENWVKQVESRIHNMSDSEKINFIRTRLVGRIKKISEALTSEDDKYDIFMKKMGSMVKTDQDPITIRQRFFVKIR
jgi:hypothetical protein